ncbi:glutamate--tRNA ligase [Rhodovibrio sodomensis]|uniref:Glutamate--tRNA ligase n=1 Tax=Rhodovibrio sodomensis TaxID=1088 RepID=A0ABS1DED5_9PROT|nr:glutamate--tRNA ligase [Rhodovibrio sodomensis]
MTVRFAPSPTGYLQLGNARTALVNWLFARQHGGTFLLRLDDTDHARGDETYVAAIREDLTWLGLNWDQEFRQSGRIARYQEALRQLEAAGYIYPCYETEEELEAKRKAQAARRQAPVYDRAALGLTAADRQAYEAEGRTPHWRFKLEGGQVAWDDQVRGRQSVQAGSVSDPVLIRADGRPLYTLTSVVDDLDSGVTHVIRGEDHVTNTAAQIQLFQALGGIAPGFAHLPLLLDASGEKLSKRTQGLSLRDLRADEVEAMALNSYLAKLGTPDAIEERQSLNALIDEFDLARMGRGAPKYDGDELMRLNARLLHATDYATVRSRLEALGLDDADRDFWETVRPNLTRLSDARQWYQVCRGTVQPVAEEPDYLATAAELLPPEPWGETTWQQWTAALKQRTGRKGKALFRPLRLALTGMEKGPELAHFLPLIGREKALRRLNGETA